MLVRSLVSTSEPKQRNPPNPQIPIGIVGESWDVFWESNPTNIESPSGECFAGDGNTLATGGEGIFKLGEGISIHGERLAEGGEGLAESGGRIAGGGNELAARGGGVAGRAVSSKLP